MPNLMSKARQNRIDAIAILSDRRSPRSSDADRSAGSTHAAVETNRRPSRPNIFI
ncbi:hypothetical protein [Frigidibacter sp. ROC022]|uniref:hypothetical protein n=1 Tax=Frigidibacter sp. ROC022 TaxID=2971796 RepID=UPI00215A2DA3|nr:hypothetical protein [Frigidibacter sp. ROC022]MCR8724007.1 hypothetical protein [Frigidibacter sp. ROC022]